MMEETSTIVKERAPFEKYKQLDETQVENRTCKIIQYLPKIWYKINRRMSMVKYNNLLTFHLKL